MPFYCSIKKAPADVRKRAAEGLWRTFQMSNHLLLWVEPKIDFGTEYLDRVAAT